MAVRILFCNFAPQFLNYTNQRNINKMIIVQVKDGESIEKALKKFKRKFEKTGVVR